MSPGFCRKVPSTMGFDICCSFSFSTTLDRTRTAVQTLCLICVICVDQWRKVCATCGLVSVAWSLKSRPSNQSHRIQLCARRASNRLFFFFLFCAFAGGQQQVGFHPVLLGV